MSFAPAYLVYRLLFRIAEFFRHWYGDGTRWFVARLAFFSYTIDRTFGVRLPGRRFAQPSISSFRNRGFFARTLGVALGAMLLVAGTFCAILYFAVWASLPILPLAFAVRGVPLDAVATVIRTF